MSYKLLHHEAVSFGFQKHRHDYYFMKLGIKYSFNRHDLVYNCLILNLSKEEMTDIFRLLQHDTTISGAYHMKLKERALPFNLKPNLPF